MKKKMPKTLFVTCKKENDGDEYFWINDKLEDTVDCAVDEPVIVGVYERVDILETKAVLTKKSISQGKSTK